MKKLIIIILLVGMASGAVVGMKFDVDEPLKVETYEYIVRSGDTLNGIVYQEYSEYSGYDVREVVWNIRNKYNDDLDAMLYVGQTIKLPKEIK